MFCLISLVKAMGHQTGRQARQFFGIETDLEGQSFDNAKSELQKDEKVEGRSQQEGLGIKFRTFDLNEKIPSKVDDHSTFISPIDSEMLDAYQPDLSISSTKEADCWYSPRDETTWI
jgi:hypothetical protein